MICLKNGHIVIATLLTAFAVFSIQPCKAEAADVQKNYPLGIQSISVPHWLDQNYKELVTAPICIHGKFYNEQENGSTSSWEPINNMIEAALIGLVTKVYNVSDACKRLLHRSEQAKESHESWCIKPELVPRKAVQEPLITWLGHSTFLIQINGITILTDPIFGNMLGYKRRVEPVVNPQELPHIDIVLLSHNHRDHMDEASLLAIKSHQPIVLVPTNTGAWFRYHGFEHVIEKSWWEQEQIIPITTDKGTRQIIADITCVPAKHWSTRYYFVGTNSALCSGWYIRSQGHSIYFVGDTGYKKVFFEQIRSVLGKPELVLMPIGPNEPRTFMHESHMSTEQAIEACKDIQAQFCIPMHWGTFGLGTDTFDGPVLKLRSLIPTGSIGNTQVETKPKFGKQWKLI